jgi:hypothetical protein
MKRPATGASLLTFLAAANLAISPAAAQGNSPPTIKEIMAKLNKPGGLYPKLGTELKEGQPDWEEVQKQTKVFVQYALALGKNEPRRGDKDSWAKFTKAYAENAKALDEAARKRDALAARDAHAKLGPKACSACHNAHRPSSN